MLYFIRTLTIHLNSFMTNVLQSKLMDWFLHDRDFRHEKVNATMNGQISIK